MKFTHFLVLFLILFAIICGVHGCYNLFRTNKTKAKNALIHRNMTPINVGGYGYFMCDGEYYSTKFTAKNIEGGIVSGAICQKLFFKGTTMVTD